MTKTAREPSLEKAAETAADQVSDDQGRASGSRAATRFYEPLPIGSDAFATPLAPTTSVSEAPGPLGARRVWLIAGAAFGVAAVALGLAMGLKPGPSVPTPVSSRAERAASPEPVAAGQAMLPGESSDEANARPVELPRAAASSEASPEAQARVESVRQADAVPGAVDSSPPGTDHALAHGSPTAHSSAAHTHARSGSRTIQEQPDRAQVIAVMAAVQPAVSACFGATHGTATANIRILGSSGRVTTAHVTGQPGGIGSCIARAVRHARFPKFTTESLTISYPFGH